MLHTKMRCTTELTSTRRTQSSRTFSPASGTFVIWSWMEWMGLERVGPWTVVGCQRKGVLAVADYQELLPQP